MVRPFDMHAEAFAPMYGEAVVVRNAPQGSPVAETLPACIFEAGFDVPVDDEAVASERRAYNVLIPKTDWRFPDPPRIGMSVEVRGLSTTVEAVAPVMGDWQLTCRERRPALT